MNKTIEGRVGECIDQCAARAMAAAKKSGAPVTFTFNGTAGIATPDMSERDAVLDWAYRRDLYHLREIPSCWGRELVLDLTRRAAVRIETQAKRIEELEAALAAAKSLRLGRAPTVDDVVAHMPSGGRWMLRRCAPWYEHSLTEVVESGVYEGDDTVGNGRFFCSLRSCGDAIPLDANGNPCPIGGWADESEGGE